MATSDKNPYLLTLPQLLSAKKKIGKVAANYNPQKDSRQGFESESLTPSEFREQLRYNFDLHLTNAELGALVVLCDPVGVGLVDTREFLTEFLRLGKIEREKEQAAQKESAEQVRLHKQRRNEAKIKKLTDLLSIAVSDKFTEEDTKKGFRKIAKVAFYYEKDCGVAIKGFLDGGIMPFIQFKDQLRRNLDLTLSPAEFGAVCHSLRSSTTGCEGIDCNKFVEQFVRLGNEAREQHRTKRLEDIRKIHDRKSKADFAVTSRATNLAKAPVASKASEEDFKSAETKLRAAAFHYNPDRHVGMVAFQAKYIDATSFREQLKQIFGVTLTAGELKALVEVFDDIGNSSISCRRFLARFNALGDIERHTADKEKVKEIKRRRRKEDQLKKEIEDKGSKRRETKVLWPSLPPDIDINADPLQEFDSNDNTDGNGRQNPKPNPGLPKVGGPWSAPSSSLFNTGSGGSGRPGELRHSRKPPVRDAFAPSEQEENLRRNRMSLVDLFPKASADTKEFIKEIEKKEKEIRKMCIKKKKTTKKTLSQAKKNGVSSHDKHQQQQGNEFSGGGRGSHRIEESDEEYESEEYDDSNNNHHSQGQGMGLGRDDRRTGPGPGTGTGNANNRGGRESDYVEEQFYKSNADDDDDDDDVDQQQQQQHPSERRGSGRGGGGGSGGEEGETSEYSLDDDEHSGIQDKSYRDDFVNDSDIPSPSNRRHSEVDDGSEDSGVNSDYED